VVKALHLLKPRANSSRSRSSSRGKLLRQD
jgi:hypothetical protein